MFPERRLQHREEAGKFYRDLAAQGMQVRVGMEASGQARWFERLLSELHFELWIGDASEIRTKRVRKQKTDRQDAQLILRLLLEDRFPKIWVPSWETRELRQLLWNRHRMVQARTRITGAVGRLQRTATTAGPHHETKRLPVALLAGGSGASHGTQRPGMAWQLFPPGHAARGRKIAKVAIARKLAVRMYWMWRKG